ncbi:hypothetical protein [Levilactobacillus brevis]|uniref:hypothetical protein n=1 Tax=Levilactobacillus brevis TaxID=1580 RepID=UPI000847EE87|nr:hypothetical protein [Levilactobacillus brevis]ODP93237.1 hypothetical protein BGC39_01990 [Levilactobacillus brevis]
MQRSRSKYFERNGKSYLLVELDHQPNLDHIETVSGSRDQLCLDWGTSRHSQGQAATTTTILCPVK